MVGVCKPAHRGQEIRHSHPGVQHSNKISRGDALPLGGPQHFGDGAFYNFPVGLWRSSDIHCPHYNKVCLLVEKTAGWVRRSLLRAFSKSPNSSSNFGPSGCANRAHRVHRLLRPSTFCRNARAPVCAKLHTRMTVVSPVLAGQ